MFEGKLKISKKIYVFSAVIALIAAGFASLNLITSSTNNQQFTETDKILPENEDINEIEPLPEIYYEPEGSYLYQRAGLSYDGGGKLEWKYKVADEELSTPALADLNPNLVGGQGDKEIVVASAGDLVMAIKPNGDPYWSTPYTDCIIDNAETFGISLSQPLDFDPTPFFSSITPVDIAGSPAPELIVGEKDGIICLNPDGTKHWSDKGLTTGYYFSTVGVTDLEGDFAGIDENGQFVGYRDDLELIMGSDDQTEAHGWLEAWKANGDEVFRLNVHVPWEHGFMTNSIVCAEMDGWFEIENGPPQDIVDNNPETLWQDLLTETHGFPGRIIKHQDGSSYGDYYEHAKVDQSHFGGHETYATAAVGNFSMNNDNPAQELEALVGHSDGLKPWTLCTGSFLAYDQDGHVLTQKFQPGGTPSGFYSSPAVCDAQNVDEDDLPEGILKDYEVYVGSDNNIFYCLDVDTLSELWSYQTGGRILSSPAICNIYADDMMEVVIGSDDGNVYCFEGDPMELDVYGEAHPSDDGVEDAGGSTGEYDLLWVYETGGSGIGISSPVVADIDNDKILEVIIGDRDGWLYCIEAGGNCVPGQADWIKFHCDLNNTGFYNPSESYGVDLSPTHVYSTVGWRPDPLEKSVKPGAFVQYNITVTNTGSSRIATGTDTFFLNTSMFVYQGGNRLLDPLTLEPETKGWYFEITGKDVQFHETLGLQYVVLETMSSTMITLTVHAPWEGELSEFTQIVVEANSGTDPWARDSLLTTTNLEILLDFSVHWDVEPWEEDPEDPRYGMKYVELNPSATERIKILVKNKGNLNDTYALEIKGIIDTWGAGFTENQLETYTISLDAGIFNNDPDWKGSEIEIDVYITVASDAQAGDMSNLKVICTSLNSKESTFIEILTREDILIVNTKPENELDLSCDDPQKYVDPGNNISFTIRAENNGNAEIDLLIEHSEISVNGWEVEHITEISIYPNSKQKFDVEITSPMSVLAGDKLIVTIKGSIIEDGLVKGTDTVALIAIVHNCCWIESDVSPSSQIVNPGDEVEYFITIYNKGNGNDFIKISPFIIKVDWGDVTFEYNGDEFYNSVGAPLEWMENITIPVRFTIPGEELAGSFITTFNVTALKSSVLINVETVVNQMFDLNLLGYKDVTNEFVNTLTMDISPGWTESFLFKVTNKGNAPETIELELEGLEQEEGEWRGYFSDVANTMIYTTNIQPHDFTKVINMLYKPDDIAYLNADNTEVDKLKLHLGIDQTVYVKAKVSAPTGLPEGEFKIFTVNVNSEQPELEDPVDNEVKITLDILFADLIVDNIGHPRGLQDGKIITISAYVKNIGDIEARDVFIILYIDDKEIKSIQMTTISKGTDDLLITFNWQASGGQHKIKIEVDPENTVVEKNDQFRGINNNVATNNIDVASEGLFEAGITRAICSLLPVLIAVITMAILIVLWKKRGMFRFRD